MNSEKVGTNMGQMNANELVAAVRQWAVDRNMHTADPSKQFLKVAEEVGEIARALAKQRPEDLKDAIGDSFVTLIILAEQCGVSFEESLQFAYDEIKDRKGKMVNGVFIKEDDLRKIDTSVAGMVAGRMNPRSELNHWATGKDYAPEAAIAAGIVKEVTDIETKDYTLKEAAENIYKNIQKGKSMEQLRKE